MAWTSPRTWITGEFVTAAMLNANVRDDLLVLAARLYAAVDTFQPVSGAADTYGDFTTVGPSITIVKTGTYDVLWGGDPGGNSSFETATLGLMKNGTEVDAIAVSNAQHGGHFQPIELALTVGDVLKLQGKDSDITRRIGWGRRRILARMVPV